MISTDAHSWSTKSRRDGRHHPKFGGFTSLAGRHGSDAVQPDMGARAVSRAMCLTVPRNDRSPRKSCSRVGPIPCRCQRRASTQPFTRPPGWPSFLRRRLRSLQPAGEPFWARRRFSDGLVGDRRHLQSIRPQPEQQRVPRRGAVHHAGVEVLRELGDGRDVQDPLRRRQVEPSIGPIHAVRSVGAVPGERGRSAGLRAPRSELPNGGCRVRVERCLRHLLRDLQYQGCVGGHGRERLQRHHPRMLNGRLGRGDACLSRSGAEPVSPEAVSSCRPSA